MYYQTKKTLSTVVGNNALSYEQRKAMGSLCQLSIPALKKGTLEDVKMGNEIVFEEIDHKLNLQSCIGLESLIEISSMNTSYGLLATNCYVIDNHNHALYLRYREHLAKNIDSGTTLIHIDQHADMGVPTTKIDIAQCNDIDYIATYTNEICNVGNFIQPAIDSGLILDVIQVRSVTKLLEMKNEEGRMKNYILDIDIDFRVDHSPTKEEIIVVHKLLEGASVCTIALSPYFMPIEKSIEVVKILFS